MLGEFVAHEIIFEIFRGLNLFLLFLFHGFYPWLLTFLPCGEAKMRAALMTPVQMKRLEGVNMDSPATNLPLSHTSPC
jgi:hypothetical protein